MALFLPSVKVSYLSAAAASNNPTFLDSYNSDYQGIFTLLAKKSGIDKQESIGQALILTALGGSTEFLKKLLATGTEHQNIPIELLQIVLIMHSCMNDPAGFKMLFHTAADVFPGYDLSGVDGRSRIAEQPLDGPSALCRKPE